MDNFSSKTAKNTSSEGLISKVSPELWKNELEEKSSRYHIIASWVAIVFDPVFGITDYLNIPGNWVQLLIIRFSVAAITLTTLLLRKKLKLPSYAVVAVPFLLIALQNAYTYSLIGNDNILGHSLNFIALFIGAALFVLWPVIYSAIIVGLSMIATAVFVAFNPALNPTRVIVEGGLLLGVVAIFMIILIQARYNLTVKEIKARLALEISNSLLEEQKLIVEQKNEKITDSISYASKIQVAILGHQSHIENWFSDAFVFFKPKDILSGDFYWFYKNDEEDIKIVIAADCTGHGVPAAMMTTMGNTILNDVVIQRKTYEPDQILYELDQRVIETFAKDNTSQTINDGMDMTILAFHKGKTYFSGAKNPVCIVRNKEVTVIKGSRFPIGSSQYKAKKEFEKHTLEVEKGDSLYIFSDGYQDQFGGTEGRKYLSKRFRNLLAEKSDLSMKSQFVELDQEFQSWKGSNLQTDDILVVGLKI